MYSASMFPDWYKAQEAIVYQYAYDAICADIRKMGGSDPWWMKIEYGGEIVANTLLSITMFIGGAIFDVLALGQGTGEAAAGENPALGIFSDGLRVLALAGPVSKVLKVFSVPAVPRVFAAPEAGENPFCTLMSTANALRAKNIANFATVADLSTALGLGAPQARYIGEVIPLIGRIGGVARMVTANSLKALEQIAKSRPGSVFLVDLRWRNDWKRGGEMAHTLCMQWDKINGCVKFMDPSGAFGKTLAEVEHMIVSSNSENVMFQGLRNAVLKEAGEIERARTIFDRLRGNRGLLGMIGLEMLSLTIRQRVPRPEPGPTPR